VLIDCIKKVLRDLLGKVCYLPIRTMPVHKRLGFVLEFLVEIVITYPRVKAEIFPMPYSLAKGSMIQSMSPTFGFVRLNR
jgi:hypothetical protein